ncbi:MAG: EAL domain-containing protein [Rhodospirillum sp.]|nr:EAL domain-containing protein [Rhodospirillum sp.]MCF8488230.1 EAL domain-containing protein [Rhodospirillum sp.]MCF8501238.1 EAL domain-containing protein [Rhodospirillum sp.]
MSLRLKVAFLSAALLACLTAVLAGVLWVVVRPTFENIEQVHALERMATVQASLAGERESLQRLAVNWASWDDMYDYVLTRDTEFKTSNLVLSTFADSELHYVAILDTEGRTIWSITLDQTLKSSLDTGLDSVTGDLPPTSLLMRALTTSGGITGLVPSPQGPLLASAQPILTSEDEGPARGVLIMARRLDYIMSDHIPRYSGVAVDLRLTGEAGVSPGGDQTTLGGQVLALMAPGSKGQIVEGIGGTARDVTVATRLNGLDGAPLAVALVTLAKRVEPPGMNAIHLAILVALVGGLVIILAFWYATKRIILDPLGLLERHITDITRTGDLNTPLILDRSDEIGALARSFETMRGRIRYLVHNDPLTGLPNRDLFLTLAERSLTLAREDGGLVAVAFIDIDRFKTINDSLGQESGDALLSTVARRLSAIAGKSDLVARYGGDEFLMLLCGLETPLSARDMASRLIGAFEHPFSIGDQSIYVTASLGLGLFPRDSDDLATLISHANAAMNHAKALGRNNFQFFDGEVNTRAREILAMEGSLRQALTEDRLELRYQPQVDASTGRLIGLEALVRWNHPTRGLVAAEDFLPFVEQSGLHATLDRWVLETACRQSRAWRDQGLPVPPVAVNLSARHFEADDLYDFISGTLDATGARPEDLAIEITETVMMRTSERTKTLLKRLRRLGFQVVIDDFGTGFASLSYLREFPLDRLKIDKTFIGELPGNTDDTAIVRAVLALARELDLDVLAEGVERQDQADWLVKMGCHMQQGYLHGHPLSPKALGDRLTSTPEWLEGGLDHAYFKKSPVDTEFP